MIRASLFEDDYDLSIPALRRPSESTDQTSKMSDAVQSYDRLRRFMSWDQLSIVAECMRGEEKEFFFDKLNELAKRVDDMPVTYEQDGKGGEAIAYLHYFLGDCHWYITEKDMDGEVEEAFGYAVLHGDLLCAEYGFIPISELVGVGAVLDFHFDPKPMWEIKEQLEARYGNPA